MGKVYTPAQAKATAKYLAQFRKILLRVTDEDFNRIQTAVEKSGKTQKDFLYDAVMEAVERQE